MVCSPKRRHGRRIHRHGRRSHRKVRFRRHHGRAPWKLASPSKVRRLRHGGADGEFYDDASVRQRVQLKQHPGVQAALARLWDAANTDSRDHVLDRAEYGVMHRKMLLALRPMIGPREALRSAEEDWAADAEGEAVKAIDRPKFEWALFELADLWTDSVSAAEYADFCDRMLAPDHDARRGGARALARRRGDRPPALPRDQADGRRQPPGRTRALERVVARAAEGRRTPQERRCRRLGGSSAAAASPRSAALQRRRRRPAEEADRRRAAAPRLGARPPPAERGPTQHARAQAPSARARRVRERRGLSEGCERGGGARAGGAGGPGARANVRPAAALFHAAEPSRDAVGSGLSPWQPPPVASCIASVVGASVAAAAPRAEQDAAGVAAAAPAGRAVAVSLLGNFRYRYNLTRRCGGRAARGTGRPRRARSRGANGRSSPSARRRPPPPRSRRAPG